MADIIPETPPDPPSTPAPIPEPPKADWLKTMARASETVAPLVKPTAPDPEHLPQDRRGRWAALLASFSILVAATKFILDFFNLISRPLAPLAAALPLVAALLLVAGTAGCVWVALRPGDVNRRRYFGAAAGLLGVAGLAWGGWTASEALRPPDGLRILVAEFDGERSGQQVDFARRITDQLRTALSATGAPIEIRRSLTSYADSQSARSAGNAQKAGMVIWGWYDDLGVSPHVEVLVVPGTQQPPPSIPIFFATANAAGATSPTLDQIALIAQPLPALPAVELYADYGPDQLTYVTAAVLGLGYLAGGDTAQARSLLDTALTSAAADPTGSQGEELVRYQRALLRYTDGDATAARTDLEAALAGHEDFYEATSLLAVILADDCTPGRDLSGALALAGQATALRPDDAEGWQRLAGLRLRTGDLPGALAAARQAQTLAPADPAGVTLLATIAQAANRPAEAATAAQSAEALLAQATSGGDVSASLWFDLGDLRLSLRQWDAAASAYRQGLAQRPDHARGQAGLGRVLAKQGRTGEAEAHYRAWSTAAPQTTIPHLYLALLLYEQGRVAETLAELQLATQTSDCNPDPWMIQGAVLLGENNLPGAEAAFRQALALEAGNGQIELSLGGTLFLASRFEEAIALLQSAVEHQPSLLQAHYALAQSYRALGDEVRAQAAFARVTALAQPGDPPSLEVAVALAATGRPAAAGEIYRALLAEQESPELHAYLADLYESTGQTAAAVAELRTALALDPHNQLTLLALGNLLVTLGDNAEAAEVLERYAALADSATVRTLLAHLYEGMGQPGVAAAHLQRAARLEPDNPDFPRLLAELAIDQGHLEQAERYLDDAMQLQPDDAALHATRSDLAYKRCNLDRAVLERERAVALAPENNINRGVLASLYSGQGRNATATPLIAELQNASDADFFAHLMAGAFLAIGDDRRDAEAELRVAVAISGTAPLLLALGYGLLGDLYLQQGDAPGAQASFDRALVTNPAYAPALAGLGDLALEAGNLDLAQRRYTAATEALAAYGSVYGSDQARLLAIHLAARRSLATPAAAAAALAEAEQLARTLLATMPDWPDGRFALGLVLATAGRPAEAEAEFGAAIACDAMMAQRQGQAVALLERLQLLVQ